jgi:hypothetical protein
VSAVAQPLQPLYVVDAKTNHVSALPGSEGMWSPRWSPDGRFIAGLASTDWKLMPYDLQIRKQTRLFDPQIGYPSWSADGALLFFRSAGWLWRARMRDLRVDQVTNLDGIRVADWGWFATAPNNSLVTARDAGTDEIYALDWEAP